MEYKASTRSVRRGKAAKRTKEQRRLGQLLLCLVLFFTVFIGKGVFPERVEQVSGQLLSHLTRNTDFRGLLAELGETLAEQENLLGELGEFCIEVFGPGEPAVPAAALGVISMEARQAELNNAQRLTISLGSAPEPWCSAFREKTETVPEQEVAAEDIPTEKPPAIPAAGTVLLEVEPPERGLPVNHTVNKLSLGGLETAAPLTGTLWSGYGYRDHPIDGAYKFHSGVDLGADMGTPISAFADGVVEYVGQSKSYGNYLQLDHGSGVKSFYAHCSQVLVRQGERVSLGDCVARVGDTGNATGPHLHFEVKCGGQYVDPSYYL